jgi:hypothetical protein
MAKFDLKKAILENKATFFGSLNEGQFSWITQDTDQQIGSQEGNTIPVYMFDNTGKYWYEPSYEGYGEFGGMDYYELLDKMNGGTGDRDRGIDLAFDKEKVKAGEVLFPALVTKPNLFNYKYHNFTQEADSDPNQSWLPPDEEDEDDEFYYGDDDYKDNEEELEEGFQGQFYAPEYLEQKYGKKMASKIEAEIDEMDENSYDRFTGMESAEEVENYIVDIKDMLNLNEGTIEEAYNSYTFKVAKNFAKYMSKKEGRDFEVTMNSVDEYSFDLDLDGEPYAGGSYLIQNGNIHNVAIPGNPIYATTDDMEDYIGEGYDEFKRADKGSKGVTAKNKGEEEVYGAGVKKGEEIEKKKMKMSEFKAKIKEMVLAEMNLDIDNMEDAPESEVDFLAEIEEMLNEDEEDFSIKLLVPTIYFNPETGELAETPAAFGADSELEDMGITNYSDGDELSEWVFDNSIEKAKYFEKEYPGLFKVEGMMNENATADIEKKIKSGEIDAKEIEAAAKKAMSGDSTDLALMMAGFGKMFEAKKDEEVADEEIEVTDEFSTEEPQGPGGIDVTQNADADLTGDKKDVQDNLEAALEAAKALGDDKLATQIGNSLTFFTKQHVVKEDLNEDENLTESKYKKGDMLQTYGGEEEVTVIDIKSNLAAALADTENPKAVGLLKQNLRQNLIDDEDKNKPFYLVTSNSFPEDMYYVESELKSSINESMFPMLKKILK